MSIEIFKEGDASGEFDLDDTRRVSERKGKHGVASTHLASATPVNMVAPLLSFQRNDP